MSRRFTQLNTFEKNIRYDSNFIQKKAKNALKDPLITFSESK